MDSIRSIELNAILLTYSASPNYGDIAKTPYGSIPGVFLQAQMTSQLISAAIEHRPLFWAHPVWIDSSIILLFSTIGGLLVWALGTRHWVLLGLGSGIVIILCGSSVVLLTISGYWLPLVPTLLGLVISGSCVKIYLSQATKFRALDSNS